jgi:hypothetical protein
MQQIPSLVGTKVVLVPKRDYCKLTTESIASMSKLIYHFVVDAVTSWTLECLFRLTLAFFYLLVAGLLSKSTCLVNELAFPENESKLKDKIIMIRYILIFAFKLQSHD